MAVDYTQYENLPGSGSTGSAPVAPELEFFHSIYISGKSRKINEELIERSGMIQIRGVSYNHDSVNMIITHIKDVLVNEAKINNKDTLLCFSYKDGEWPWYGTNIDQGKKRICGKSSAERAASSFCANCRAQIIVAGMLCEENGKLLKGEDGSPIFGFIRGKGMKYSNVSSMVNNYVNMDITPYIFESDSPEVRELEKRIVNHKRFVTKIGMGTAPSKFGDKDIFVFETGTQIPVSSVITILEVAKKVNDKFLEKFDWSKGKSKADNKFAASQPVSEDQTFDSGASQHSSSPNESKSNGTQEPSNTNFSFSDLDSIKF